ncbi:hypothetical protein HMN09_00468200 [Mycena chlorophos]|uniref:Uncharacterized protein n=1 Tax=Mycena chlorophos TaxID=658473 RepID=A0A8H6TGX7_MYCCL|nr:hypothetical protein HMN09_00468200 [Mycena chlorophos]
MSAPLLPPELERHIFLLAAYKDPATGAILLRVASRVLTWVEPTLYESLDLHHSRSLVALVSAAKKKPHLLRLGVEQLMIPYSDSLEGDLEKRNINEALRLCVRLQRLTLASSLGSTTVLEILSDLPLRRLVASVEHLLSPTLPTQGSIVEAAQLFKHLTHLESFDSMSRGSNAESLAFLAALPALTHFASVDPPPDIDTWLKALPRLRVLVLFHLPDSPRPTDQRLAVTFWELWHEGACDEESYWDRADEFLEKKARGEVPETEFRTEYQKFAGALR